MLILKRFKIQYLFIIIYLSFLANTLQYIEIKGLDELCEISLYVKVVSSMKRSTIDGK